MTTTADTETRGNRDGHPCPPWCTADHDRELIPGYFETTHGSEGAFIGPASARAVLCPSSEDAEVQICVSGRNAGSLFLDARHAGYLAILVEDLADATPEAHRELAAAIRKAAADLTGQAGG
jgi:hypothetical protein